MVTKEAYKFRQDLEIPCYQTDPSFRMKPAGFMDLAQELAQYAANALGFGYDTLHIHHVAWVLSRMHIHFDGFPLWRDPVSLYTWHKGPDGLFFLRDFFLDNAAGEHLVRCTSSWVIIDEQTRHLIRPDQKSEFLKTDGPVDDAIVERAPKLVSPQEEGVLAGEHTVVYSDVDFIGHSNNVRYVVWSMDILPYEEVLKRPVKDLYINFIKETTLGQTVSLYRTQTEDGFFVEGRVDGKAVFTTRFVM